MLSFTYVYFFESGLFNGLEPIQIKIFLQLRLDSKFHTPAFLRPSRAKRGLNLATGKAIARASAVRKAFVAKSAFQVANAGGASLATNQASGWRRLAGETDLFIALKWTSLRREGDDR